MTRSLNGKNIFVTGSDGFIGSHLVNMLVTSGANVRSLVYYNSWNEVGWLRDLPTEIYDSIELFSGDVRDAHRIQQGVKNCDYVFHLASLIAIPYSYEAPQSYIDTNVLGALNILQACRKNDSLTRLVHLSTSEVYGSAQFIPISEEHPLVAQSPYAASKIAADKMAESYNRSFGLPVVIARPFNTFGPRQTARAVIPTIACQLLAEREEIKLGSLTPKRDFNYVTDTANGILDLALCSAADGDSVNIGSGKDWSIMETVEMLIEITGHKPKISLDNERIRPKNSEVDQLLADNKKIRALTGWKSRVSFYEGLKLTVEWIQKNRNFFDADQYSK